MISVMSLKKKNYFLKLPLLAQEIRLKLTQLERVGFKTSLILDPDGNHPPGDGGNRATTGI